MASWILASTSPFRRQMLEAAGLSVRAQAPRVDERALEVALGPLPPARLVRELALAKAREVAGRFPGVVVVGADQLLELDGEILGKAPTAEIARERLARLSGRTHHLMTAVALVEPGGGEELHLEQTDLRFRELTAAEIDAYIATGEWQGCAGSYRVEGVGVQLIAEIRGDWFNIVGLPLLPLLEMLRRRGEVDGLVGTDHWQTSMNCK